MSHLLKLYISSFLLACAALASPTEEETLSLNGDWKFTTIPGDGSSTKNTFVSDGDIVIDNDHPENVTISGKWKKSKIGDRGSHLYGKDHLTHWFKKGETGAHVRYASKVPSAGHYEHFINSSFGLHLSAQFNVKHADGISTAHLNQRVRANEWVSLGIFKIDPNQEHYIEITAITDGGVSADAVMYRPVSDKEIAASKVARVKASSPDLDDSQWDTLTVPGHWGMLNKYSNYTGKGWYRRNVTLPKNWKTNSSEKIRLKFGGVYHVARVFFNGKYIGQHRGGFTPFEFDVTELVKFDSPNQVTVEADNNFLVGATWNWGGIIRDVSLVKNQDLRISYQYIHADPDLEKGDAALSLKVRVENNSATEREIDLIANISRNAPGKSLTNTKAPTLTSLSGRITVPANSVNEVKLKGSLPKESVHLWHFDSPHLYHLTTSAKTGDKLLHTRKDRFGIRKIRVTDSQFFLNGEPVRLAGFNRVSDHRYWGSSEPQDIINQDVDLMKNAGANMMRIMHGTQNKKLIERCDEKGILLIEEINVRDLTNPEFHDKSNPLQKQWLREMIERDINHPSIIGWSTGNELSDHYDYVKDTINYVKTELDPHRLVACVSNTGYRAKDTAENDPLGYGDLILQNCYMQRPDKMIEPIRKRWPDKAIFFSEFGIYRFVSPSLDQEITGLENWHESLKGQNEFVIGASLWTYNDYRSAYLATLPSENRAWGLVNVWRQKRRLYNQVQRLHSAVKHSEISAIIPEKKSAKITLHLRGPEDYPSFTLKNYQLVWAFRDQNGKEIYRNSKQLPTLKPSDGTWSGEITWKDLPKGVSDFTLNLMTPNGYTRFEKVIPFQVPAKTEISSIVPGNQSVRVHFEKIPSATEYSVRYREASLMMITSPRTIGDFLDVEGLINGHEYEFEIMAWNAKGYSIGSKKIKATPNGKELPPRIWDASITDDRLVIGYDGEYDDIEYEIHYGSAADKLHKTAAVNVRGMMTFDLNGASKVFYKLRRKTPKGLSNWSPINQVSKKFKLTLAPAPPTAKFEEEGKSVWGGSLVKGDDGLYHMFYSRWDKGLGWAWVTHSEIAHATSASPYGPFKFQDVALPIRGAEFWDGLCTHNPTVHKFDGKYYLYYMGNTGDGVENSTPGKLILNPVHRNNQRIGVAVADSPSGPWKRTDTPLIDVSPDPNALDCLMVSNPSVTKRPDGGYLMVYKAVGKKKPGKWGGPVVHCIATSDSPTGPFKKYDRKVFEAKGVDFPAEDPSIWYQDGKYRAIVKDMHGAFTDAGQALVNFESENGFDWNLADPALLSTLQIQWTDGRVQKLKHLERPQLYLENGKPVALLCAADTADENNILHSFNVQIPIKGRSNAVAQKASDLSDWKLVWSDEFDYENSELDKHWDAQNGPNKHISCSRWRENVTVENGFLKLLNKKENRGGQEWTSGSIWTKKEFKYGYFECRYRYAAAKGTNNSFWLMTRGKVPAGNKRFEIDINEGHYPNEVNTNIHNWSDITVVDGKKTHPSHSKSHPFGVEPNRSIQLEIPIKTKKVRLSSKQDKHFHIGEFQIFNVNAAGYPNVLEDGATKAGLTNFAADPKTLIEVSGHFNPDKPRPLSVLTDGKSKSSWISPRDGEKWIEFTFDSPKTIGCIQFSNGWNGKHGWTALLTNYKVEYHNGSDWVEIGSFDLNAGEFNFASDFHVFGLEWNADELIFTVDGEEIRREKNTFCHTPSPIWLSLAIISWDGEITDAIDGTSMDVDYVRYYQKRK